MFSNVQNLKVLASKGKYNHVYICHTFLQLGENQIVHFLFGAKCPEIIIITIPPKNLVPKFGPYDPKIK